MIYKNQQSKQGSVMIRTEMGATDLTSSVMAAPADGQAFFELGMKYASGRSGPADLVAAHKWFNVAFARGYRTGAEKTWEFVRKLAEPAAAPIGFNPRAATEGVRFNEFYLFQNFSA